MLIEILNIVDSFLWSYVGFTLVITFGFYFSIKTKFYQFHTLANPGATLRALTESTGAIGVTPLKLYFASVGGMVGLGNVVAVMSALLVGGPGSLFWLWVASIFGMLVKYSETYLGIKYRIPNQNGGYDGGPMYYLREAFKETKFFAILFPVMASVLLMIYGVEIYQFVVISDVLSSTFVVNRWVVVFVLLALVLYGGFGGIPRLAEICSRLIPAFLLFYIVLCLWVIVSHASELIPTLLLVVKSAFVGHAPVGGFVGSTFLLASQLGTARAVYSGDIAIGFDSIIQSESKVLRPEDQARLAIFAGATDSLICTMSIFVVLITGVWYADPIPPDSECIAAALALHIPYADIFMAGLLFLTGYTTLIAYLAVGTKASRFLFPKYGKSIYFVCAVSAFVAFSYLDQSTALLVMSLSGAILMQINLIGIWRLRREVKFVRGIAPQIAVSAKS